VKGSSRKIEAFPLITAYSIIQLISCKILDNTTYKLYNYSAMKKDKILNYQNTVLKALSNKIDDFYLAGGTALSLFYFQHRLSVDLDFFSPTFSINRVNEIIQYLEDSLKKNIQLVGQNLKKDKAKIKIYNIYFTKKDILKIDFVEDVFKLIKKPKIIEGIKILSLEDIYIRKLYAVTGVLLIHDMIGKKKLIGGRVDAKDFFDIYYLSHTFNPLSKFINKYGNATMKEGLINWFRTYSRMQMIDGILNLHTDKKINYKIMERHFKKQIDEIIEGQIGTI